MKKIFWGLTLILTLLTATAFAAEDESTKGFDYTSQTYGFKIICPTSDLKVVVNPFEDTSKRGELLVFANDGMKILFGYQITLDAFNNDAVPDFNKASKKILDAYIEKLKQNEAYEDAEVVKISPDNSGLFAVTAREIEVKDENGEVEGVLEADSQNAIAFFRTRSGRCISIQLIADKVTDELYDNFRKSVMTYRDATDLAMPTDTKKNKKSKK